MSRNSHVEELEAKGIHCTKKVSENISPLQEYFDNHHSQHLEDIQRRDGVSGRMEEAFEKSDGTISDAFYHFFDGEMRRACGHAAICIVYMPDFGVNKRDNKKGKIIIEIVSNTGPRKMVEDCFEFQLAKKTKLQGVKTDYLERKDLASSDDVVRYYNMFLDWNDALPLVQRVLFCPLFRQRFLMTTASRNLGSITTHRFLSSMGQVLSFRSCVLNE